MVLIRKIFQFYSREGSWYWRAWFPVSVGRIPSRQRSSMHLVMLMILILMAEIPNCLKFGKQSLPAMTTLQRSLRYSTFTAPRGWAKLTYSGSSFLKKVFHLNWQDKRKQWNFLSLTLVWMIAVKLSLSKMISRSIQNSMHCPDCTMWPLLCNQNSRGVDFFEMLSCLSFVLKTLLN